MKYLVCVTLIVLPLLSIAQLPIYYTELVKGDVGVYHDNTSGPVKPRSLIYLNDIIRIKDDRSEITLVNNRAEYVVLNKKGNYKVSDLKKMNEKTIGVTTKYFHLVWKELLQPHKDYTKYNVTNMGSWGGVTRGNCSLGHFPFPDMILTNQIIIFKWDSIFNTDGYQFTIKDATKTDVMRLSVRDNQISVDMSLLSSKNGEFYWNVNRETTPCKSLPDYKFTVVTKDEYQAMADQALSSIVKTGKEHLKAAELLERRGLYEAAAESIKRAAAE